QLGSSEIMRLPIHAQAQRGKPVDLPGSDPSSCIFFLADCAVKPGFRRPPIALHSCRRYPQGLRGLLDTEPTNVAQLDNSSLSSVEGFDAGQRVIQRDQFCGLLVCQDRNVIENNSLLSSNTFIRLTAPRVLYQDSAHRLCGDREEVSAVLQLPPYLLHQSLR